MSDTRRTDRGSAELELVLTVGLILIPIAVLMTTLPRWPEAQTAATATAKEAATLIVTADTLDQGLADADAALNRAASNLDHDLTMSVNGEWCRGCEISVDVTVKVPAVSVPGIGSTGAFNWTATSTARIDDYRSFDP